MFSINISAFRVFQSPPLVKGDFGSNNLKLYDPLRPRIWQSPSKQIATPSGVERTTIPSAFIKLWAPVSCLILSLATVSSTRHRVPITNLSLALKKAPAADISLVCNSNISVLCEEFIVSLAGSSNWNLSYLRRSFIN